MKKLPYIILNFKKMDYKANISFFLLAALHNWDLFCGTQICRGMVDDMEITYIGRTAVLGFIGLVMMVYDVHMYFAARRDEMVK